MRIVIILLILATFTPSDICGQIYMGIGLNRTFAYRFNDQDINFSTYNPTNQPLTKSYLENRHYNFWAPFVGYRRVKDKYFHDIRFTVTNVGARSLLDKKDYEYDAIVAMLRAQSLVSAGPSRFVEFGAINHLMILKYGYGRILHKFLTMNAFAQLEYSHRKEVALNWYDARYDYVLYEFRTYGGQFFPKDDENKVYGKSADYNLSLGLTASFQLGKYFAIQGEIAQNVFPSVYSGPSENGLVYWEKAEYFTAMQVSFLTYFSRK